MDLLIENYQKVEILPLLRKRYQDEIREDVISVKFVTNHECASLEFIYLENENTIVSDRMALGPDELLDINGEVLRDENNNKLETDYFDLGNSVVYNAKKFIFELDEYSKLMMVGENLFTQSYIDKIVEENF
jgi:hypothetical protein